MFDDCIWITCFIFWFSQIYSMHWNSRSRLFRFESCFSLKVFTKVQFFVKSTFLGFNFNIFYLLIGKSNNTSIFDKADCRQKHYLLKIEFWTQHEKQISMINIEIVFIITDVSSKFRIVPRYLLLKFKTDMCYSKMRQVLRSSTVL